MTLTIHKEKDDKRQLKVTVEVAEKRVDKAMRATARKLARDVNIPGFRKGRVPYPVIVRRFGKDAIRAEAVEEMVSDVFQEVVTDIEEDTYGQPSFDDMEMEPLVMKFTIPLAPQVTLGDYRALRKEVEAVNVTDGAVAEALENVQTQHQELETVERPAEAGDVVVVSGKGVLLPEAADAEVEGEEGTATETAETEEERIIFNQDSAEILMDGEKAFVGTPFVENVIGMSAGQEKTFEFTFAEDFEDEDLARRSARFEITVEEVKKRTLPPLDDELAKLHGQHETLDELRESLRENLQRQAESEARDRLIEEMTDDLLADAELVYPPAAMKIELDEMVESFKQQATRSGWQWEDYLRLQGQTEEDLRADFEESATERLERRLVMGEFIKQEKLTVSGDDVDEIIEARVANMDDNPDLQNSMRDFYRQGYGFEMISSEVLMDKVYGRVVDILAGEAPDLDAIAEAESLSVDEEE